MKYRAYIVINKSWTEADHERAKEALLRKIAKDNGLPLDHVSADATIVQRESAVDGLWYFAEYSTDPPARVNWPNDWA